VSQAVVIGDDRPFVAALVTIDEDAFADWVVEIGVEARTVAEAVDTAELRSAIAAAVDDANLSVSRAESIREFAILPNDFTIEAGELTPTLKVRRAIVHGRYQAVIESIYTA
jgi:long-chain acyl-CoA synthetase